MGVRLVSFDSVYSPIIIHVRTQVFVKEQEIDPKIDFDGLDESATHALVFKANAAVATGRILDNGHIGRIAVLRRARKKGVGTLILNALTNEAKKRGDARVYLGSQMHAVKFYEKLGFNVCGEIFMDAGIEHIEMEQILA